ncbi:DUF72 domain-containing protein [Planococcus sp. ISL-110]|uniref:DUF72 domain-containing protein n=1 Tax=Planococcus sp. ISL-110 TaxID=2819167 RepID=UPI001BE5F4AD|nr:DUF72 domain-containing protein [Planococcus sp. ISL-110]MBT2571949.1 DUF72 domain-containing protein [Planococcus sp. ISL-110]
MIYVGLTGWGDHPDVYSPGSKKTEKLIDYGAHFPIVELDSSFYAVQPERNIRKWIAETPKQFQFVVKAYQGMTGHQRGENPFESRDDMFDAFCKSIRPLKEEGKLAMVLLQFPPWFDCQKDNVEQLREITGRLTEFDLAIEFRHQSWYANGMSEKTLDFLRDNNLIHSVCDEPQAGDGSIPLVPISSRKDKVLLRIHGRNVHGWLNPGHGQKWREVRYLYDYNKEELEEISRAVESLTDTTENVYVIFNNNSGGHAAGDAKQFQKMNELSFDGLSPKQMDLFEGGF